LYLGDDAVCLLTAHGDNLRFSRRQGNAFGAVGVEQLDQCRDAGQVPVLGSFDMFELRQFVDGRSGQLRKTRGVEFFARDGKDRLPRINQRSQHNHGPFGFKPIPPVGTEILHPPFILNEF